MRRSASFPTPAPACSSTSYLPRAREVEDVLGKEADRRMDPFLGVGLSFPLTLISYPPCLSSLYVSRAREPEGEEEGNRRAGKGKGPKVKARRLFPS